MKPHLRALPILHHETPSVHSPSKRLIVLIPLARMNKHIYYATKDGGMIGAIWARHTWLTSTDAIDYGIEIKFYIEDVLESAVLPILKENRIDMKDVIFFDGSELENDEVIRLVGKKMIPFWDVRFKDYDWIFTMDCDIFAMAPAGKKLPFFEEFFKSCIEGEIGNCYAMNHGYGAMPNWVARYSNLDTVEYNKAERLWKQKAAQVVSREMVDSLWAPEVESIIAGGEMHAYPAKCMMEDYEMIEWFRKAASILQDDEVVMTFYHLLGNPVWNIREAIDFNRVFIGPEMDLDSYARFKQYIDSETPFIFHFSINGVEFLWRKWMQA